MNPQDSVTNTLTSLASCETQRTFIDQVLGDQAPQKINAATINKVRKALEGYLQQHSEEITKEHLTTLFNLNKKISLLSIKGDLSTWYLSPNLSSLSAKLATLIKKFNSLPFDPFPPIILTTIVEYLFSEERYLLKDENLELPFPPLPVPVRLFFEAISEQQVEEFVYQAIQRYQKDPSTALEIQQFFYYTCFDQQEGFFDIVHSRFPHHSEAFIQFVYKAISPLTTKLHLPMVTTAWIKLLPVLMRRLKSLQSLKISGVYGSYAARMIQSPTQRKNLRKLKLSFPCDDKVALAIANTNFPNLKALQLDYDHHTILDKDLGVILKNKSLKKVSQLTLAHSFFLSDRAVKLLAQSDLPNLEVLNLKECRSIQDLSELMHSEKMLTLKTLDVSHSPITDSSLVALANNRNQIVLESLSIAHTKVTDVGLIALSDSVNAQSIKELNLEGCKIEDPGLIALGASRNFKRLEILDLGGPWKNFSDEGLTALGTNVHLIHLKTLKLPGCAGSPRSLSALIQLPGLRALYLSSCPHLKEEDLKIVPLHIKVSLQFLLKSS